jgi:hypothetical protein
MLAQFRARYPTGQLISELLTVHHGKFVVRSLVQVDGKTLATAMSAAESVEEAEDRARLRSLAVLGFNSPGPVLESISPPLAVTALAAPAVVPVPIAAPPTPLPTAVPVPIAAPPTPVPVLEMPFTTDKIDISHQSSFVNTQSQLSEEPIVPKPDPLQSSGLPPTVDRTEATGFGSTKQLDSDAWLSSSYGEPIQEPDVPTQSLGELLQGAAEIRELQPVAVGIPSDSIEDSSDTIAQIDAILKRLQWKKKQESDCLEHNYGKLSQGVLSAAELVDFLEYLEIYSKTTDEIKRLGWSPSQGKDYLKQGYGKEARHFLNKEELLDFLQYLESLP